MTLKKQSLSAQDQKILRALDRAAGDLRRGEAVFVFDGSAGVAAGSHDARPPGETPGLLVFSLDHADADTLALVQQLYLVCYNSTDNLCCNFSRLISSNGLIEYIISYGIEPFFEGIRPVHRLTLTINVFFYNRQEQIC